MPKSIALTLPHNLTQEEVKRRIIAAIADGRAKHPEILKGARETWTGNQMDFTARAMGQSITGRILIEAATVQLSLELPFMLAMFAGKLKPQIEAEGRKLLEKK